jgi:hypothetical protein
VSLNVRLCQVKKKILNRMKLKIIFLLIAVWAKIESASVVRKSDDEDLFPLSIIHLNDFHAR